MTAPEPIEEPEPEVYVYNGVQPLMHYAFTPSPEQLAADNYAVLRWLAEERQAERRLSAARRGRRRTERREG